MARKYNFIYSQLVDGDNDIIGHVAYSLYKADKINYIEKFKEENPDSDLSEEDLKPFHDISCMKGSIDKYKMQAVSILQIFLDDTLSSTTKQMEDNFINTHKEIIKDVVKEWKPKSFWNGIWQSLIAAFIFMFVMCALIFLASLSNNKYCLTFGGSGNASMNQVENTNTNIKDKTSVDTINYQHK